MLSPRTWSMMTVAVWVMTQHWDPSGYSLSSLPKVSIPCFSSGVSSPLCPCLCQSPGYMSANENFCVGLLNGFCISSCPSLAESNTATSCHQLLSVYFLCSGALGWEFQLPHCSRRSNQLLNYLSSTAAYGHLASFLKSPPHSLPDS